jgi:RES domain-containing protein
MLTAWRIVQARYQDDAFSGEGARLRGGRWNSKGTIMVYTAGSIALASIEMVVNLPGPKLLEEYVRIPVNIPPDLILDLPLGELPNDWNSRPAAPSIKAIGDRWIKQGKSAVLKVPSVVIPEEYNYLLSPNHPDFAKISVGSPINYRFDPRLANREK